MVRCIVECCPNNSYSIKYAAEHISFLQLPKIAVLRDVWFSKIQKVKLPPKTDDARICSVHFTDQSFTNPALCKLEKGSQKKRRLLPTALPSLHLGPAEQQRKDDADEVKFNVVRRVVDIPVTKANVIRKRKLDTEDGIITSESSVVVTPTKRPDPEMKTNDGSLLTSRGPWVDENYRSDHTPAQATDAIHNRGERTFPRRSQRLSNKAALRRKIVKRNILKPVRKHSTIRRSRNKTSHDELHTHGYASEETTPPWKRSRRFAEQNLESHDNIDNKIAEEDDPYKTIELLKAELKYHRSLSEFHSRSKSIDLNTQKLIEAECTKLTLQLKAKEDCIKKLVADMEDLKKLSSNLHTQSYVSLEGSSGPNAGDREVLKAALEPYFTEGQIRCIIEKRKWVKWSIDDYAAAISLRSISPKAYRFMRNRLSYPLPSLSSLRRWALLRFNVCEGFLLDVLAVMKEKSKVLSSFETISVVTFGEMALAPEVCFDSKFEKLIGPCGKVQVIMVRGLFSNWKQPIYYTFDQPMTKSILDEALTLLDQAGYQVVASTCDMGNKGVWKQLGITVEKHFFEHPSIKDAIVYVFADVPHLLKLLRNWLVDDGFYLHTCTHKFTADIFQSLVNASSGGDLRVAHKVTQRILDARNTIRQAVWPAAQLFSHSAGSAIKWAGEIGVIDNPEYEKIADFVLLVNSWFDVQNTQKKYGSHPGVNAYGVNLEEQELKLQLMSAYVQHMRVGKRKSLMPFQQGILISNASLRGLHKFLKKQFPDKFEYIITRRLQQDVLEIFFSYIRGMGATRDHPSGYEFRYRLRWYVTATCLSSSSSSTDVSTTHTFDRMQRHSTPNPNLSMETSRCEQMTSSFSKGDNPNPCVKDSNTSNCAEVEVDLDEEIVLTRELFMSIINISPAELSEDGSENHEEDTIEVNQSGSDNHMHEGDELSVIQYTGIGQKNPPVTLGCANATDVVQEAGLKYVAGYVAHRFRTKYRFLGEPTKNIDTEAVEQQPDWIRTISRGYLLQPSAMLLLVAEAAEKCFTEFHGTTFSKEDQVVQKVVMLVKKTKAYNECIPEEVLQCLVRTRTYIRVREMNKKLYVKNELRKAENKMKKIVRSSKLNSSKPCT